jgi:hypothetical protein
VEGLDHLLDLLNSRSGVLTMLVLVVVGIHRQWWYPKWAYRSLEKDRDFWRDRWFKAADHADKAIDLAKGSVEP